MIDLTCVPATQNPSSPRMVCTTTIVVVTAATDGGLLSPLRESAMRGANAQNGTIHRRMSNTPTRRRNGDMPADFASSVDDPSPMQIPGSIKGPRARASHSTVVVALLARAYGHLVLITACHTVANLAADSARTPSVKGGLRPRSDGSQSESQTRATCLHVSVLTRTLSGSANGVPVAPGGKGIDVVDGSHRIPKCQLVRRRHRLEAPLDDSLEPRFPVIGWCRRSES